MINKIWLCDLTYTQQVLSSDVMPTAIAGIGTYVLKHLKPIPKIEIINKTPKIIVESIQGLFLILLNKSSLFFFIASFFSSDIKLFNQLSLKTFW